jgi:hypothetical protein
MCLSKNLKREEPYENHIDEKKPEKDRIHFVLFAALLAALAINASAAEDTKHLAFTSDSHFDTANTQNNLEVWMDHLQDKVDSIEYMAIAETWAAHTHPLRQSIGSSQKLSWTMRKAT